MSKFKVKVGKREIVLSQGFLKANDAMENLEDLKDCYSQKLGIYNSIDEEKDPKKLKELARQLTNLENEIQELFNFEPNVKFHRFWESPKCSCAKMDNQDRWPTGSYVISGDCPLHGVGDE